MKSCALSQEHTQVQKKWFTWTIADKTVYVFYLKCFASPVSVLSCLLCSTVQVQYVLWHFCLSVSVCLSVSAWLPPCLN